MQCHSPENAQAATARAQNGLWTVPTLVNGADEPASGGPKRIKTAKTAAAQNDTSLIFPLGGHECIGQTQSVNGMTMENSHMFVSIPLISPQ